jgi:hypothetical protein
MRATLEEALTTHPVATGLLGALRERRVEVGQVTGPRLRDGATAADDDETSGSRGS